MKYIKTIILVLLVSGLNAQQIEIEPNIGLAVTGTGMTVCFVGTTMRSSPQLQYTSKQGYNYVSYDYNNKSLRVSTLIVGAVITISGIVIQNIRRNKKSKQVIKI